MLGIIENVGIESLATTVSKNRIPVTEFAKDVIKPKRLERMVASTGVEALSIVRPGICASDMCVASAQKLLAEGFVKSDDIGAVLFVTQSPDYIAPATSYSIQNRLGLETDVISFDVNCGCQGFVYGIYIAASIVSNMEKKVLLCYGDVVKQDTRDPKDTAFKTIMGDGAGVAVIERKQKSDGKKIFYRIDSYGERFKALYIPRGGARENKKYGATGQLIEESENYTIMDGMAVTDFSLHEVPDNIKSLMNYANVSKDEVDIAFVHQANRLFVSSLAERLGVSSDVMPFKCAKIGNTDMASIPVCMTELKKEGADYTKYRKAILSGFGAGLSVASMIIDFSDIKILPTYEI